MMKTFSFLIRQMFAAVSCLKESEVMQSPAVVHSFRLHELPTEVLDEVLLKFVSPNDIVRLALVSKSLYQLVRRCRLRVKLCERPGIAGPSEVETARCKRILFSLSLQFPYIESLDLSWTNVSDADVEAAVQKLPNLMELSLSNCTKITENMPNMMYPVYRPQLCPKLQSLNLSRCFQLTDSAISRVLQWSACQESRLRAASFAKLQISSLATLAGRNQLLERIHNRKQQENTLVPLQRATDSRFRWSSLRILCLNNIENVGICMLDVLVTCCPNLGVLGLGGSLLHTQADYCLESSFFAQFQSMMTYLNIHKEHMAPGSYESKQIHATALLSALIQSLNRLWLLELTFFQEHVCYDLCSFISKGLISLSPKRAQAFRIIDFNSADSVIVFRDQIGIPFRRFVQLRHSGSTLGEKDELDCWRFEDFPSSFMDLMINTASTTSRGGSMISPNSTYSFSQTPLICAAGYGDEVHVDALIKMGVVLELRGLGGGSPLLRAAREGHVSVALLLLEAHVDPLSANRHNENTLYMASLRGHEKFVDVILSFCEFHGIDWKQREVYKDGWTPLMAAAVGDHCGVARCLLSAAASSAADLACMKNRYKQTALHIASYRGCKEMVQLLMDVGGRRLLSEIDCYGRSALTLARNQNREQLTTLLLQETSGKQQPLQQQRRRSLLPHVDFRSRWLRWVNERDCPPLHGPD